MAFVKRVLRALPLLLLSPLLVFLSALALAMTDLCWKVFGRRTPWTRDRREAVGVQAASVVIPNWNGRDLLEKYLPSIVRALSANPDNEIVVVDNGSTDGSVDLVRSTFPQVNLLALPTNLGFGGGSNAGFRAARNDIVVLLNSDMRVAPDFLAPLLEGFRDPTVFAVACQIFFSDPTRLREETGLTQGWWEDGGLRVRHRIDPAVDDLFPCFYGGGGSCAFDRAKFLELGGFDHLLAPFYLEDTDLGYLAWKRGWKVLYQPRSIVYHEHRGTIGKHFRCGPQRHRAANRLPRHQIIPQPERQPDPHRPQIRPHQPPRDEHEKSDRREQRRVGNQRQRGQARRDQHRSGRHQPHPERGPWLEIEPFVRGRHSSPSASGLTAASSGEIGGAAMSASAAGSTITASARPGSAIGRASAPSLVSRTMTPTGVRAWKMPPLPEASSTSPTCSGLPALLSGRTSSS